MYGFKVCNFHGFLKEKRAQGGERKQLGIWEGRFQVLFVIQIFLLPLAGQLLVSLLSTSEGKWQSSSFSMPLMVCVRWSDTLHLAHARWRAALTAGRVEELSQMEQMIEYPVKLCAIPGTKELRINGKQELWINGKYQWLDPKYFIYSMVATILSI